MDVYCPRCGEPWEIDYVNFEMTPEERSKFWAGEGCPACKGKPAPEKKPLRAEATAVLRDMLGDDTDGIAAELEDFGF